MGQQDYLALFPAGTGLRYFSLARHALIAAFETLGVRAGDKVLLPDYVCRDLLASLYAVGALPVWYSVKPDLSAAGDPEIWPEAKAVLAVNYFGFPQKLQPFSAYAARTGACIIEDNAHGFLSRDADGRLLGCRTTVGILSFRKTLLLGRGAALVINQPSLDVPAALPVHESGFPWQIDVRRKLRALSGGRSAEYSLTRLIRILRTLRGQPPVPPPADDAETHLPEAAAPDGFLLPSLALTDLKEEILRRRNLYNICLGESDRYGLTPVFPILPPHTVPYGFAVFAATPQAVERMAASLRLDCFRWPDLPAERVRQVPPYYSSIYLINFL